MSSDDGDHRDCAAVVGQRGGQPCAAVVRNDPPTPSSVTSRRHPKLSELLPSAGSYSQCTYCYLKYVVAQNAWCAICVRPTRPKGRPCNR